MTKIPIVFTFDKRVILASAVAIKSLIDSAKIDTIYDIYVFHPDIDNKTILEFEKIIENSNHNITFKQISKDKFKNAPINKNGSWTEIVYYRLLIPELLPQYDKVIYSDIDVFFKGDLSDLYNTDIENYDFAGVRAEKNTKNAKGHKYFEENKNEFIFWSGFMLVNSKKMREDNLIAKFYKTIEDFKDRLKYFDLDTINIACDNILPVSIKYCLLEALYELENFKDCREYDFLSEIYSDKDLIEAIKNPMIIHYAGQLGKPWRRKKPPSYYSKTIEKIPKKLRKYTFRDLRKRFFSKI